MLAVAKDARRRLEPDRSVSRRWRALGVDVQVTALPASGAAVASGSRRTALIGKQDDRLRRQYTIAHEFGHMLLADAKPRARWKLDAEAEETLCEQFASELLIGRDRLASYLRMHGYPTDPRALLAVCSAFKVNLQPMFHALRAPMADTSTLLIASRLRGHENRPGELAFRVEAAVGNQRIFVPRDQRLVSLGLDELAEQAGRLADRETVVGSDWPTFSPRRVAQPISVAEAQWKAMMVGGKDRLVLVALDVGNVVQPPIGPVALTA
ncbi:MAG: ImmA/IrrE family metallo-endopeptidase [Solirubrobacterales bacterium]